MVHADAVREHYRFLQHSQQTEIRVFGGADGPIGKYSRFVDNEEDFVSIVTDLDNQNLNVGVGVNERKLNGTGDDDVTTLRLLPLDLDSTSQADQDIVESFLRDNDIPLAAKIFSGQKGYHYYVKLNPITDPLEIRRVLANAKAYFSDLPLDPKCFNPSRIFRVWGTRNRGRSVEIIILNHDATRLDASTFFPNAAPQNLERVDKAKQLQKVIPRCSFLDAYFNGQFLLDVPESGANFNDVFVPNAIAYAHAKRLPTTQLYKQIKNWHGYDEQSLKGWERKRHTLDFSYAQLRGNVKEHYPLEYDKYFAKETLDNTHNVRYEDFDGTPYEYKQAFREADWLTIANNWTIKARVVSYDTPQELVQLALAYEKEETVTDSTTNQLTITSDNPRHFLFFDEIWLRGPYKQKEAQQLGLKPYPHQVRTNVYTFTAIDPQGQQWLVLSEERLTSGDYVLHGTRFDLKDKLKAGNTAALTTSKRVLLLHSFEREDHAIASTDELYEKVPFTLRELSDWLLTDFALDPPPTYDPGETLRELYLAWLFSGNNDGRQLNLCVMGPPGSGKTPQLVSISQKFNEEIASGTTMTIKGLTVSFYGDTPRPGAFLKAKRVLFIDEFFKILNNRNLSSYEDLTSLNSVLDSGEFNAESGKFTLKVKPTCKLLTATNPVHERFTHSKTLGARMSFARMCEILPSDFVGRVMFLIQTPEEYRAVTEGERIEYRTKQLSLSVRDWLAAYDFINQQPVYKANAKRVRSIVQSIAMPDVFRDVYAKSTSRNALLLFHGVVRSRCFAERVPVFEATEQDYVVFERLWKDVHLRWFSDRSSISDPLSFLTEEEQQILGTIQREGFVSQYHFQTTLNGSIALRDKLRDLGLVEYDRDKKQIRATDVNDDVRLDTK